MNPTSAPPIPETPDGHAPCAVREPPAPVLLDLHPDDYALIESAARRQGFSLADFIELAAYLYAREIVMRGNLQPFADGER